jgi:GTP cyclohydrolase II
MKETKMAGKESNNTVSLKGLGTSVQKIKLVAQTELPTKHGIFTIMGFLSERDGKEYTVVIHGDVVGKEDCPVRIHSECHTGEIWGSLRCDCRQQLEASIKYITSKPYGMIIYCKQEGRGIGLLNKLKAYHLQDNGLDTVEANLHLGFPVDMRDYCVGTDIIQFLGIKSVALLTNNPEKIQAFNRKGIPVTRRIPLVITPNKYNERYLRTKKEKLHHLL